MLEEKLVQIQRLKSCTGKDLCFIVHDVLNTFLINCFIIGFNTRSQNNLKKKLNLTKQITAAIPTVIKYYLIALLK